MLGKRLLWLIVPLALFLGACCEFDIVTTSLPNGVVGQRYQAVIQADCTTDTEWYLDGQLPPGIGFTASDDRAELDGTPQQAGEFSFTVTVTNFYEGGSETASRSYLVRILDN